MKNGKGIVKEFDFGNNKLIFKVVYFNRENNEKAKIFSLKKN